MLDNWPREDPSFGPGPVQQSSITPSLSFGPGPVQPSTTTPLLGSLPGFSPFPPSSDSAGSTGTGDPTVTFPIPNPTQTGSSSGSLTISSMQPVQTPPPGSPSFPLIWSFDTLNNATTCEPFTITWSLENATPQNLSAVDVMSLYIQNNDVTQNIVNQTIVINVPLAKTGYTWSAVTVPSGSYVIQGIQTQTNGTSEESPLFFVQAGTNTSCVTSTGASLGGTLNTHNTTRTAAIAGGVVGGLVLIACLAMAVLFIYTLRKKKQAGRARKRRGGWGGLDSVDIQPDTSLDYKPHSSRVGLNARATQVSSFEAGQLGSMRSVSSLDGEKTAPAVVPRESVEPGLNPGSPTSVELAHLSSSNRSHRSSLDTAIGSVMSTSSGAQIPRRASRTPRKPVPAYDPTPEELNELSIARSHSARSTVSQLTSATTTSIPAPASQSHHQHSSTVSQHNETLFQGLKSKSSGNFENQPIHYLIPDLPPPPRD
ncbi:hypothetical protein BU17DRAFT_88521 [Hysterangium stoloniferum]|nr:hypothetical protein BU17DRAFT_88521 [Hysterangium stoloniferum]